MPSNSMIAAGGIPERFSQIIEGGQSRLPPNHHVVMPTWSDTVLEDQRATRHTRLELVHQNNAATIH